MGAVPWYRVQQPLRTLNDQGYSCAWSNRLPQELWPGPEGNAALRDRTTILGQYVGTPIESERWQRMAAEGQRVFYEMDDDVFSIDRSNPAHHDLSAPGLLDRVRENLRVATGVITTRLPLADVIRQHTDAPIFVIPNYIPEWLLTHRKPEHPMKKMQPDDSMATVHWRKNLTVVGWSGSSNHLMDWEHYAPRLIQWITRTPQAVLHVMGEPSYIAQHRRELPEGRVVAERWYDTVEEYFRAITFDIAVIPLRKHPFNESKSWIAALIYAALGIPVVASDVGPYHDFVVPGRTGILFRTPGEMADALNTLIDHPWLREEMSVNAQYIASLNTYERNAWKWAHVLLGEH